MARLAKKDITEILEFFEKELDSLRNMNRIEKMRMKSRIRKQAAWLMAFRNPAVLKISAKLEEQLSDLFRLYHGGFKDKFRNPVKKEIGGLS